MYMRGIIFILLFSCSVYSQTVDSLLVPYVEEYIQSATKHEVDVRKELWGVRYIKYKPMTYGLLGTWTGKDVLINDYYTDQPNFVRAVIYHEIGHVMGLKHLCRSCDYIMSSSMGGVDYTNMSNEEWEKYKTDYFNSIKNKDNLINIKIIENGKYNRKKRRNFCTDYRLE